MKSFMPLFALVAVLLGCSREAAPPAADIRPVRVEPVAPTRANAAGHYAGEILARYETTLAFRVPGRVSTRQVEVGTPVKAGQLIATLDPQDYALAVHAMQAQRAAAEAESRLAQQDLQRFTELRAQGFISQAELDRRRTTSEAAQSRLQQLRAEVARLGNQQAYTRLTAPHAGVVTALAFEAGNVVAAGQPLAQLARSGELEVRIDVPENAVDGVRQARNMTVRLWAQPDKVYLGRLRELSPMADAASRTYSARVSLLQPDAAVKLGMTATVEIGQDAVPSLSVAQSALFRVNGEPQVWVVDRQAQTVAVRSVRLGAFSGQRATVVSGLAAGEWVVTAGVHKLAPGQRVRLSQAAQP
jgi:membrane fusion protein, multidrug efflux system